jgi:hypothetical protein
MLTDINKLAYVTTTNIIDKLDKDIENVLMILIYQKKINLY